MKKKKQKLTKAKTIEVDILETEGKEKDIIEKAWDLLLNEAAALAVEELGQSYPEPAPVTFSKHFEKRMRTLFRKKKAPVTLLQVLHVSQRAAVLLLAMVGAFSMTMFSVKAWREQFIESFFPELPQASVAAGEEDIIHTYTNGDIFFGYIPEGFWLASQSSSFGGHNSWPFQSAALSFTVTRRSTVISSATAADDAVVTTPTIHGEDAFCRVKAGRVYLIWRYAGYVYSLEGNISEEEALKIAENTNVVMYTYSAEDSEQNRLVLYDPEKHFTYDPKKHVVIDNDYYQFLLEIYSR